MVDDFDALVLNETKLSITVTLNESIIILNGYKVQR